MLFFFRVIEMNEDENKDNTTENPYLLLGFWNFAIISTLVVLFFPFSLLFCVIFYGLEQTKFLRTEKPFFIDKMPNNFSHVGLIKLILPNAKIIDARRNPMDTCFSCYKQLFARGQAFTYDLPEVARYYLNYV